MIYIPDLRLKTINIYQKYIFILMPQRVYSNDNKLGASLICEVNTFVTKSHSQMYNTMSERQHIHRPTSKKTLHHRKYKKLLYS